MPAPRPDDRAALARRCASQYPGRKSRPVPHAKASESRHQIRIEQAKRDSYGGLPRLPATTQLLPREGDFTREIFDQHVEQRACLRPVLGRLAVRGGPCPTP